VAKLSEGLLFDEQSFELHFALGNTYFCAFQKELEAKRIDLAKARLTLAQESYKRVRVLNPTHQNSTLRIADMLSKLSEATSCVGLVDVVPESDEFCWCR